MTGSTRKPTVLLSLVKDKKTGARFVSLEGLSPEQREQALRYQRIIAPGSVLVGVVLGVADWDVRPVILQRGSMTITRMFSPELLGSIQLSDAFKSYVFHAERLAPGSQGFSCGSGDGHSWVTRKFFNQLLSDVVQQIPLNEKILLVGKLLADIEALQQSSMIHGHIHPTNIAYEEGRLVLIDHGFQLHDPGSSHPPTLAPELRSGVAGQLNATPASDMYGIGLVAKRLFGSELGLEFGNLIEVLLLSDPKLRPKLSQITSHFVSGSTSDASPVVPAKPGKEVRTEKTTGPEGVARGSKLFSFYMPALIAVMIGIYLLSFPVKWIINKNRGQTTATQIDKYWSSGQPALMQQVVSSALHGDASARQYVLDKLESGYAHPAIQKKIFTVALNPLWQSDLKQADEEALLTLGLTSLVPADKRSLPDLSQLHPGVILAIVGNMAIDENFAPLTKVSTDSMTTLPSPYGPAYLALQKLGVQTFKDPSAQALSHILTLDFAPSVISTYLKSDNPSLSLARLEILLPMFNIFEDMDKKVYEGLSLLPQDGIFSWFSKDVVAQWSKVTPQEKLLLFNGVMPAQLSQEQYLDLLRFPRGNVRDKAKSALTGILPKEFTGLLEYLSSATCTLTRTQTISLISTLRVDSHNTHSYILQWFDTGPDPDAIVKVLIETGQIPTLQAFNIEASRFLVDKKWKATIEDLAKMAGSNEPFARTLAYSRLRVDVPEQREIIRKLAAIEPVQRIKEQLLQRLSTE